MYALLGICIVLAALLTLNALGTLMASALWRAVAVRAQGWSAETRARILFVLRLFPLLGAIACVLALLTPSYITHEPVGTHEIVSTKLALLASASAVGIALALWRGLAARRATHLLLADWLRHAEPLQVDTIKIPAYRIRHPFPVIAIVGALKPKLFIATQVFETLDEEEIAAAVAHERGHLMMFDNLKRTALRACRDALLIVPCGRSLDRAWDEASEAAADEFAARGGAHIALDLASALVKLARIVQPDAKPTMPAIAFLVGEDLKSVVWRVRRLTQLASTNNAVPAQPLYASTVMLFSGLCALLLALILVATNSNVLLTLHNAIERVVSLLS